MVFERIEQIPARGNALVQRAHDLVALVRNGDRSAREELEIVLGILSDRQDQPKPQKQPRGSRKATLASVAKQASKAALEVACYEVRPDGTVVVITGKSEATEPKSVARRSQQGDEAMKLPKYVQAWVDRDGRARCYFRRRG